MRNPIKNTIGSPFREMPETSYTSDFLGILEGKRRARIEQEKAERFLKEEEARRQTFLIQQQAAAAGYDPKQTEANSLVQLEQTKQTGDKTLYMVLAFVVIAVMAGLYFIKKR